MNYTLEPMLPIKDMQWALEKQLNKGFKYFVTLLLRHKNPVANPAPVESEVKRDFFLQKYQQLLENGKTGTVQVVHVEHVGRATNDHNNAIYVSCRFITEDNGKIFTAAAMSPRESTPVQNSVIPIFYNPQDLSVVVLL